MIKDEAKLELFGMLAVDPELELRDLTQKLGRPLSTLIRWRTLHQAGITEAKVETLLNTDALLLDRVAESVAKDVSSVFEEPEPLEIDHATGDILPASQVAERREIALAKQEEKNLAREVRLKNRASGLAGLSTELVAVAGDITNFVAELMLTGVNELGLPLSPRDVSLMTKTITDIQNAFYNRPVTNIAVNTQTNIGGSMLSELKGSLTA